MRHLRRPSVRRRKVTKTGRLSIRLLNRPLSILLGAAQSLQGLQSLQTLSNRLGRRLFFPSSRLRPININNELCHAKMSILQGSLKS